MNDFWYKFLDILGLESHPTVKPINVTPPVLTPANKPVVITKPIESPVQVAVKVSNNANVPPPLSASYSLSLTQLQSIVGHLVSLENTQLILNGINTYSEWAGISTQEQLAIFLSQMAYESGSFTTLSENLNYTEQGLLREWPHLFTVQSATTYAKRGEQAIANYVYANRYGNGDEASGDGWTYRGGGFLDTTFYDNYLSLANGTGQTLADAVANARTYEGGVHSAAFFWKSHSLATIPASDFIRVTEIVSGSAGTENQRLALYNQIIQKLKV